MTVETTTAGLAVEGNAPGLLSDQTDPADPTAFVPITITPSMTATEVAEQIGLVIDATLAVQDMQDYYQVIKVDEDLLQMVGHSVSVGDGCPLAYSNELSGDNPPGDQTSPETTQFYSNIRGQDNYHEGFYIDDVIVGYTERGEMVTGAPARHRFHGSAQSGMVHIRSVMVDRLRQGTEHRPGPLSVRDPHGHGLRGAIPATLL